MRWTRLVSYLHMLGRLNGRNSLAAEDCSKRGKIKVNFKNLAVGTCARKPWNFRPNAVHAIGLSDDSVPASSRAKRAKILCDRGCGEKRPPCTEPAWRFCQVMRGTWSDISANLVLFISSKGQHSHQGKENRSTGIRAILLKKTKILFAALSEAGAQCKLGSKVIVQ
jgi:hypothetical protein